ncbi:hypothetical protein [uncultured Lacinutrix sp.]|uniref:hypothetical protein n=1 Tax=uncultured Lacinutrix sp. TaxID=574032 RepID=UPI002606E28C|nr:hypothetical protein [uncultured Lacinutrix sp.]
MNITKRYLSKSPKELFWLSLLGIPYMIWMYSIGIELNKKNQKDIGIKKIMLNILVGYPTIYLISAWILILSGNMNMDTILPFHFGAMFCIFLLMILTSRTIMKFEKEENLKESSGIGLFFGIWYYFIGIWYIQPKLNKYIKQIE